MKRMWKKYTKNNCSMKERKEEKRTKEKQTGRSKQGNNVIN
jgi:hypothetical protein